MNSDYRTIKLFIVSIILLGTLLFAGLAVTGNLGASYEYLQEAWYKGSGTIDVEAGGENQNTRMLANNSTGIDVKYKITYSERTDPVVDEEEGTIISWDTLQASEFMTATMDIDKGDGSRKTKFVFRSKSEKAEAGGEIFIDKINGSMHAEATSTLNVGEDGVASIDIENSVTGENISFSGRFYDLSTGSMRPTKDERIRGIGEWDFWRHLNKTIVRDLKGWLELCDLVNKDMIADESVPTGIYLVPDGYYVDDNKMLRPIPDGYILSDGELFKIPDGYIMSDDGKTLVKLEKEE